MSVPAQEAYLQGMNLNIPAKDVGRCSEKQCFFQLRCKWHLAYKTPKALSDREKGGSDTGLDCRQCDFHAGKELANPVSAHEVEAWALVDFCFDGPILIETSVLGGKYGLTDIWLPYWGEDHHGAPLDLIIMIDGQGHSSRMTFGTSVNQQRAIDRRFNETCWQQEHNLLRLHSGDKPAWEYLITLALRSCELEPFQKLQCFSQSYGLSPQDSHRQGPMNFAGHRTSGAYFEAE